ncbi:hypothetical protein TRFO_23878 [Tritrichomonas foetus]|uniref:SPIN90/Ldb17 leucine-rich domain-containing protein n=1 Tax=Tritrichomonas foetus TaxID=1144522 RepID=A0A1J4KA24_9EUKA|nr:hypothetical protein TRFO_23878 [Tritrichomonas foetus]|eukprot:OHT07776.1 hypothetical protein TRFO_23878 [Tritrichomonas foetus]
MNPIYQSSFNKSQIDQYNNLNLLSNMENGPRHKPFCCDDDSSYYDTDSLGLALNNFLNFVNNSDSTSFQINQALAYLNSILCNLNSQSADFLNKSIFFEKIVSILNTIDLSSILYDQIIDTIHILSKTEKIIIEQLFTSGIILKIYDIWLAKDQLDLNLLKIFTNCVKRYPESKLFFSEKKTLSLFLPLLENDDNIFHISNICQFSANFFASEISTYKKTKVEPENQTNETEINGNEIMKLEIIDWHIEFLKRIIYVFGKEYTSDDIEFVPMYRLKIKKYCLKSFNSYCISPSRQKYFISLGLPNLILKDLRTINPTILPIALELILKFLTVLTHCFDDEEKQNLSSFLIEISFDDISEFIQTKSPRILSFLCQILEILLKIDKSYILYIHKYRITEIILEQLNNLSYEVLIKAIHFICIVILNSTKSDALNFIDESIVDKIVELAETEQEEYVRKDLKATLFRIYEICDSESEVFQMIDPLFEIDGIFYGVPKPSFIME